MVTAPLSPRLGELLDPSPAMLFGDVEITVADLPLSRYTQLFRLISMIQDSDQV